MARAPSPARCWGIYRELTHSPGREVDDMTILRLTADRLAASGLAVELKMPDEVVTAEVDAPCFLLLMCEQPRILAWLHAGEVGGCVAINRPAAVENTHRERMLALFSRHGIPFPRSRVTPTDGPLPEGLAPEPPTRLWIKRGDVHNTHEGDVVCASEPAAVRRALAAMAARGIQRAVLQEHVAGDLIKFYGVGTGPPAREMGRGGRLPEPWFTWFYHADQPVANHPFDADRFQRMARRAARALGVEIFGGDAIVTGDGQVLIIDLNAWPSFALYREEASARIAAYVTARFRLSTDVRV